MGDTRASLICAIIGGAGSVVLVLTVESLRWEKFFFVNAFFIAIFFTLPLYVAGVMDSDSWLPVFYRVILGGFSGFLFWKVFDGEALWYIVGLEIAVFIPIVNFFVATLSGAFLAALLPHDMPLFIIPVFTLVSFWLGEFVSGRMEKRKVAKQRQEFSTRLSKVEEEINRLKEAARQLNYLKAKVSQLVSKDMANLSVQVDEYRRLIQSYSMDQTKEEIYMIDQKMNDVTQKIKQVEKELNDKENELKKAESQLQTVRSHLEELRKMDPANVEVLIQKLRERWDKLTETEIEVLQPTTETAELVREELLHKHFIKNINKEIRLIREENEGLFNRKLILQLHKLLLLEHEVFLKNKKLKMFYLVEFEQKLEELEKERSRLQQQLESLGSREIA